jgi:MFS family permease
MTRTTDHSADRATDRTTNRSAIRRLAVARLVSIAGSAAASVALAYVIYQRTGSALWLSALYLLTFGVMGFVNPFAGALADRVDRRRLMIASEVLGALPWAALVFVHAPWLMVTLAFLGAFAHSPFPAASGAAIPNLAAPEDLPWANSLISVGRNIGGVGGAALGGVLVAFLGGPVTFGLNAISFLFSAVLIWSATGNYASVAHDDEGEFRGLGAGLRHVLASPILLPILSGSTIMWFAMNVAIPADAPLARHFGVGSIGFGVIDAAFGVGAIVGALLARRLTPRLEPIVLLSSVFGVVAGWGIVGLTPVFGFVLIGQAVAALVDSVGGVASDNVVQRLSPDAVRGRVYAVIMTAGCAASVVAFAGAGFLINALGPQGVYLLGAATGIAGGLVMVPGLLRLRRLAPLVSTVQGDTG